LDKEYDNCVNTIKNELRNVSHICLTLDGWTSCQQYSYLGITIHYFGQDYSFKNRCLTVKHLPGSGTSENTCKALLEVIHSWKICGKIIGIVTDNAATMRCMGNLILNSVCTDGTVHNRLIHINCNAHVLNLIVKKLSQKLKLDEEESDEEDEDNEDGSVQLDKKDQEYVAKFQELLKKSRRIVTFVHQSNVASEALTKKQKENNMPLHKLVQDMPVRWNSSYLMLNRLYEQIDLINELIAEFDINDGASFNTDDKKSMHSILCVLKYYYDATLEFSKSKYASISLVLPIFNALLDSMSPHKDDSQMSATLKKVLKHYTKFYFKKYIEQNMSTYVTASYLDIRTKLFGRVEEARRKSYVKIATDTVKSLCLNGPNDISQLVRPTSDPSQSNKSTSQQALSQLQFFDLDQNVTKNKTQAKKKGIERELHNYNLESSKSIEPSLYWLQNKDTYPGLFYCFTYLFTLPASSVPCEQLFSHTGYNVWDRRNRLSPESVEKIMVIHENLRSTAS
jgi:hypothetical protein